MDLSLQSKLLRVLEEEEMMRVGDRRSEDRCPRGGGDESRSDAADSAKDVQRGSLLPPECFSDRHPSLRDRREDIPALVDHFMSYYSKEMKKEVKKVSPRRWIC